jgi:hypothetical protein
MQLNALIAMKSHEGFEASKGLNYYYTPTENLTQNFTATVCLPTIDLIFIILFTQTWLKTCMKYVVDSSSNTIIQKLCRLLCVLTEVYMHVSFPGSYTVILLPRL